jgi:hypothetical protein
VEAARRLIALHGTDPGTIGISAFQRVDGLTVADLERALYVERSLVKHLAMRRTLFVFPRELLPLAQAGASDRVAAVERKRVIRDVEAAGLHADGAAWLDAAGAAVVAALAGGREATMAELRAEIPLLEGATEYGVGKSWGGQVPVGPRVLTTLSAAGRIVRATNDGAWTISRPRWAAMDDWLGEPLAVPPEPDGLRGLVELWLRAFGPGTERDLKWWLGSTLKAVRGALASLGAVAVDLDGRPGFLLPDDLEPVAPVEPWAALLPPLDPTTMGWADREWYLGDYKAQLFDTAGNAGPTVWWDGRIVGGWRQREDATVELQLLEDVGADALAAIEHEAERLEAWLGGVRVLPRFPSPLSKVSGSSMRG